MEKIRRDKRELIRRYIVFFISLFFIASGVSLVTRSLVGTSPISSIPYVLSLHAILSMGTFILLLNIVLMIGQMLMLGRKGVKDCRVELFIQLPVSIVFGLFIDLTMALLSFWHPDVYWMKIASLMVGTCLLGLGVSLEVVADVAMVSGEYFVNIASRRFKREFGTVKIMFDVSLVVIAVACSWILAGRIDGIREGTLIVALLTGPLVRLFMPRLDCVRKWLVPDADNTSETGPVADGTSHTVITIGREYGSGGHDIGEAVARQLDIPFYDNAMMEMVARESGMTPKAVSDHDQRLPHGILYEMITHDYSVPVERSLSLKDALFVAQSRVIRRLASDGPCVIVGRCSDYVLRDMKTCINVFIRADIKYKAARAVAGYGVAEERSESVVSQVDSARSAHYAYFTGKRWGDPRNYAAVFDSSRLSSTEIVASITAMYKACQANNSADFKAVK